MDRHNIINNTFVAPFIRRQLYIMNTYAAVTNINVIPILVIKSAGIAFTINERPNATNARSTFTLEKQVRNFAKSVGGVGDVIYVCSKTTRNRHPLSITIDANDNTVLRAKGEFHAENVARVDAI